MDYWIRNRAKGIAIIKRDRKAKKSATLKHPTITTINQQFRAGLIDRETAHKMARELIETLNPKKPRLFYKENAGLLDNYWEEVGSLKDNVCPEASYNRLVRGLKAVGPLSLHVATKPELIRQLQKAPNRREATAVVNQFLAHLGRPFRLPSVKEKRRAVTYLTWAEFRKVRAHVADAELRLVFTVLFCTGCRVGEAFAINRLIGPRAIFVERQMYGDGSYGPPKNGDAGVRRLPLLPQGKAAVKLWAEVPEKRKKELRTERFGDILGDACRAAGVQVLTARDLRHCYAIALASTGVGVGFIAQALGNSETVCNRYYAGFVLSEQGLETLLGALYK